MKYYSFHQIDEDSEATSSKYFGPPKCPEFVDPAEWQVETFGCCRTSWNSALGGETQIRKLRASEAVKALKWLQSLQKEKLLELFCFFQRHTSASCFCWLSRLMLTLEPGAAQAAITQLQQVQYGLVDHADPCWGPVLSSASNIQRFDLDDSIGCFCQVVSHRECIEMGIGGKALVRAERFGTVGGHEWLIETFVPSKVSSVLLACRRYPRHSKVVRYRIQNPVTKDSWLDEQCFPLVASKAGQHVPLFPSFFISLNIFSLQQQKTCGFKFNSHMWDVFYRLGRWPFFHQEPVNFETAYILVRWSSPWTTATSIGANAVQKVGRLSSGEGL